MQYEKLKKLIKNSLTKLKNYIKLAENFLLLEINKEKILPYYKSRNIKKEDNNKIEIKLNEKKIVELYL